MTYLSEVVLTDEQKEVKDVILSDKSCVVNACPGAGKTTFFNLLTGFDQVDEGSWTFNGIKISGTPPHKVARMGMVRTFQLTKALYRLTVIDNMLLAATKQKGESILRAALPFLWNAQEKAATARSEELLTRFKLIDKAKAKEYIKKRNKRVQYIHTIRCGK